MRYGTPGRWARFLGERGASAVEMALVLPILVTLVLGTIEFSYAFNQQISLSQAAREGARYYAIHSADSGYSAAMLTQTAQTAAPLATGLSAAASATCTPGALVTVTTERSYSSLTGWFDFLGPTITLQGKAAMRCGG